MIAGVSAVLFSLAICACAPAGNAGPERIVSLAPSYDETLIELGFQDRIVGVTTSSDYLDEVKRAERIGLYVKPNVEKIIALKPDIVFATGLRDNKPPQKNYPQLEYKS